MAVILKIEGEPSNPHLGAKGVRLAVWEITENEDTLAHNLKLSTKEKNILSSFTNKPRRLQWLAVRSLLKEFHPVRPIIDYELSGKPFLIDHTDNVSISHSGKYAALILNPKEATGIDIEEITPRIIRVGNRFTNELEKSYLKEETLIEQLYVIWGAKEVLFKMYHTHVMTPDEGVSFKRNFLVEPFELSAKAIIRVRLEGLRDTPSFIYLDYLKIGNYILIYPTFNQALGISGFHFNS